MSKYYLMAQLPSLDGALDGDKIPISYNEFYELCSRFFSKSELSAIDSISLIPPKDAVPTGYAFIDAWNSFERNIRNALAHLRADNLKKQFDEGTKDTIDASIVQIAKTAMDAKSPLDAEKYLNRVRFAYLDEHRPSDNFSKEAFFCYAIKLKLLERMQSFDAKSGKGEYQRIYELILNSDKREALK